MINFFGKKKETSGSVSEGMLDPHNIPRHVAIIMDGNGRWAKRKGLPRSYGHRAGADTLKRIVIAADDLGIKVLTVYAFSTENWKRPDEEVSYIMKLMKSYLSKNLLELKEHNVRLHVIGDMKRLHPDLQEAFAQAEADMAANTGLILNVAVNYGGRLEITQAARDIGPVPVYGPGKRRGPAHPSRCGQAGQQFPPVADGLCRVLVHPALLARFHQGYPGRSDSILPGPGTALRRLKINQGRYMICWQNEY